VGSGREEIKLGVEGDGGPGRAAFTFGAANFWAANSPEGRRRKNHAWGAVSDRSDWPGLLALTSSVAHRCGGRAELSLP